ncbi:MAG: hypothetical protein ACMUIM_12470, partial [bacterium]
ITFSNSCPCLSKRSKEDIYFKKLIMIKLNFSKKIILIQIIGIFIVIFFLWIDEILDIPHFIFGSSATPINFFESLFETLVIFLLGTLIVLISLYLLKKIRLLEGLLHMCIFCKKIRIDGDWSKNIMVSF